MNLPADARAWVGLVVGLACAVARADLVDVALQNTRVTAGRGQPTVVLSIRQPLAAYELKLRRSDGQAVNVRSGRAKPGARSVPLPATPGDFSWEGTLQVTSADGSAGELSLAFETHIGAPPQLRFDKEKDFNLEGRQVTVRLSNPAARVHLTVLMDTGQLAFDDDVDFGEAAVDTPLTLRWPDAPGEVMKLSVVAHDTFGAFVGVELFPWRVDVPHEDVVFDSGEAVVRADQLPKLDASRAHIAEVLAKVARFAPVKLYLAGHTDTVGAAASNRALSLRRARAIAQALRAKGLRVPMFVEGFGEEALAVGTPDETPEAANRRAEYVLAIDPPPVRGASFAPSWQRVP